MKKIGVLTFQYPENRNFGAMLQAYAVQTMFKNEGVDCKLIDYNTHKKKKIKSKFFFNLEAKGFLEFSEKFLDLSKEVKTSEELKTLNEDFDIFVVGSDQVWRPKWQKDSLKHYYLDFVEDDKIKIAYAASFGVDTWEGDKDQTEMCKKLANRFNNVSVREESGIGIVKNNFGMDSSCVLDPTMMLGKDDYKKILDDYKDKDHLNSKYIAHMLLDDTKELRDGSKDIANHLSSKIIEIKGGKSRFLTKKIFKYNKVSQWLKYLEDSELVITDSFHCTVFSILFGKKFVVVANPIRGIARLENLLTKLGLEERFFTNINDVVDSGILDKKIDYTPVYEKLGKLKEKSFEFLKESLK